MRFNRAGLAAMALLLASCGGEDASVGSAPAGAPVMTASTSPGTAPATVEQTTALTALGASGVGGEVTVRDLDEMTTEVVVRLEGASGGGSYAGHLHSGSCEQIGPVVQPLAPVNTAADGTGAVVVSLDRAPMTLLDGLHIVVYHGPGGTPVTCGMIGAYTM
jgi:Fe-S cluster biogenesis protein NfuA